MSNNVTTNVMHEYHITKISLKLFHKCLFHLFIAETFNTTSQIFITNLIFSVQNLWKVPSKVIDSLKI